MDFLNPNLSNSIEVVPAADNFDIKVHKINITDSNDKLPPTEDENKDLYNRYKATFSSGVNRIRVVFDTKSDVIQDIEETVHDLRDLLVLMLCPYVDSYIFKSLNKVCKFVVVLLYLLTCFFVIYCVLISYLALVESYRE